MWTKLLFHIVLQQKSVKHHARLLRYVFHFCGLSSIEISFNFVSVIDCRMKFNKTTWSYPRNSVLIFCSTSCSIQNSVRGWWRFRCWMDREMVERIDSNFALIIEWNSVRLDGVEKGPKLYTKLCHMM